MPIEMGLWRIDGDRPTRLPHTVLPSEAALEEFLEKDPSLLGDRLLVIGRQIRTPYNKVIDLLAIDGDGQLHVLELKRDRTPRDVVGQALDYGAWVTGLDRDAIIEIANQHLGRQFEAAFEDTFGVTAPDELNTELTMTIVATDLDPGSERIVTFLRTFGVPLNVVFFAYLEDEGRRYLARSWLAAEDGAASGPTAGLNKAGKRADWNGRDWFVSFGDFPSGRQWADGLKFNFVSAGGGDWYSRSLRTLPVGARVNVHVPGRGYVAVGEVLRPAVRFDEAEVLVDGTWSRLAGRGLSGAYDYGHSQEEQTASAERGDLSEYVVAVRWLRAVPLPDAYWEKGMFANQNSACKLRQQFTLDRLAAHFSLEDV